MRVRKHANEQSRNEPKGPSDLPSPPPIVGKTPIPSSSLTGKTPPLKSLVPKKKTKKQIREEALASWWNREPFPAVILAVDPGKKAGASIIISKPRQGLFLAFCSPIDTFTRQVEATFTTAIRLARECDLYLVLVLEEWGRGGPLGIDQWIGLGEARGAWRREFILRCNEETSPRLIQSKIMTTSQSRWRSRVIPETGDRSSGTFKAFTPEQWKEAAHRAALDYFPSDWVPPLDASESACIGVYAARSDELGKLIGKRELKRYGLEFSPLENQISKR